MPRLILEEGASGRRGPWAQGLAAAAVLLARRDRGGTFHGIAATGLLLFRVRDLEVEQREFSQV